MIEKEVIAGDRATFDLKRLGDKLQDPLPLLRKFHPILEENGNNILYVSQSGNRLASGSVCNYINQEGNHITEIFYPDGNESVFVEEFIHLLHSVSNPLFCRNAKTNWEVRQVLKEHGLEDFPADFCTPYASEFLSKVHMCTQQYATDMGIDTTPLSHSEAAKRLLNGNFQVLQKDLGFHFTRKIIDILSRLDYIDSDVFDFSTYEQKSKEVNEAIQLAESEKKSSKEWAEIEPLYEQISQKFSEQKVVEDEILTIFQKELSKLEPKQYEKLYGVLGLKGLVELDFYQKTREIEPSLPDKELQIKILQLIENDPRVIENIHYLLRPAGYQNDYPVSIETWLNTKSNEERFAQIRDRLQGFGREDLVTVCRSILDENIFGEWSNASVDMVFAATSTFWDLSEDQIHLMFDPVYSQLNNEAIMQAIANGSAPMPSILTSASVDTKEGRQNSVRNLVGDRNQLSDMDATIGAGLMESIESRRIKLTASLRSEELNWKGYFLNTLKATLGVMHNSPQYQSADEILQKLSSLFTLKTRINANSIQLELLTEIVAKSIKIYTTKCTESLVSPPGFGTYSILLTVSDGKDSDRHHPKSVWDGLIEHIVDSLHKTKSDGGLIVEMLGVQSIDELSALVGYTKEK